MYLSMGFGRSPEHGDIDQSKAALILRLDFAETQEEIDEAVEEAERWLVRRPYDEEVRWARNTAIQRRLPITSAVAEKRSRQLQPRFAQAL